MLFSYRAHPDRRLREQANAEEDSEAEKGGEALDVKHSTGGRSPTARSLPPSANLIPVNGMYRKQTIKHTRAQVIMVLRENPIAMLRRSRCGRSNNNGDLRHGMVTVFNCRLEPALNHVELSCPRPAPRISIDRRARTSKQRPDNESNAKIVHLLGQIVHSDRPSGLPNIPLLSAPYVAQAFAFYHKLAAFLDAETDWFEGNSPAEKRNQAHMASKFTIPSGFPMRLTPAFRPG